MRSKRLLSLLLLLSFIISTIGCGEKEYNEQIDAFQAGIDDTTAAVSIYYIELNEIPRDIYFMRLKYDKTLPLAYDESVDGTMNNLTPTGLAPTFKPEWIKARMDAIRAIGRYGKLLASLAATDAPERVNTASQDIGANINDMVDTFRSLHEGDGESPYIAPFTQLGNIVGIIGKTILESKRDRALTQAIVDGEKPVNKIISLIQNDLDGVIVPLKKSSEAKSMDLLFEYYNKNSSEMSESSRTEFLQMIREKQNHFDMTRTINPSDVLTSLKEAHGALVTYATSGRKISNLKELVYALSVFRDRAEQIVTAVRTLQAQNGEN